MGYQALVTYEGRENVKKNSEPRSAVTLVDEVEIRDTVRMQVNVNNPDIQNYIRKKVAKLCVEMKLQGAEEDIVDEVFLKASVSILHGGSTVETWLYQVARNECINEMRRQRRLPIFVEPTEADPDPISRIADKGTLSLETRLAIEWLRHHLPNAGLARRILESLLEDPSLSVRDLEEFVGAKKTAIHAAIVKQLRPALIGVLFSHKSRAKEPVVIEGTRKSFRRGA